MQRSALATERLIVPISSAEKQAVEKKAIAEKISTAEFVRRAILHYDPDKADQDVEAELRAVLEVFTLTHQQTLAQLDRTDVALDRALAHFAAKSSR
ncbi:MAG TPA: hypothetical protein VNT30_19405 [Stellaceae bacterium]|nr:hypothetical protein [Stellaceae bacterium]